MITCEVSVCSIIFMNAFMVGMETCNSCVQLVMGKLRASCCSSALMDFGDVVIVLS